MAITKKTPDEDISQRIEEIKKDMGKKQEKGWWQKIKSKVVKPVIIGACVAALAAIPTYYLAKDFLLKRQNYPERNVLFRSSRVDFVAGNAESRNSGRADREAVAQFYQGGGVESKVGAYLFTVSRELRGDIEYYNMDNSQKIRVASASQKPEKFQAGMRVQGSLNYREQFAEIVRDSKALPSQKYMVYKVSPERGLREKDVDVVENQDGSRVMVNRLVERRTWPLGWMFGKEKFRAGTSIEDYTNDPENRKLAEEFLSKIKMMDSPETMDRKIREQTVREAMEAEEKMKRRAVYSTFEDGILKILPQESTVYLGELPGIFERIKNWAGFGKEHIRLRVENHWDLWPGDYFSLREINLGKNENRIYPFDKYNNGGYTIVDKFGDLAMVDIKDFMFFFGQDVLYSYYLDMNGDGKLDKEKERIGQVLCRTTHDERRQLEKISKNQLAGSDVTFTINYSFMMPDSDAEKGMEYLKLCAYIETMMPDQIHRGNGKHSLLKFINDQRSDIMLFSGLNRENLSRALTQESTLVAKHDIVNLLIAAKRPYAKELAEMYDMAKEFEGRYGSSELLRERTAIGPLPWIALGLGGWLGLSYYRRRKKQNL